MALATYREAATSARRALAPGEGITNEGGIAFTVDHWTALRRFLILGTEGGTYYATPKDLTTKNLDKARIALREDGVRFVDEIVRVSDQGLAAKNDAALLAIALASVEGDLLTRRHAFASLNSVARIGTHILHFAAYREALGGGWGRGMRDAVSGWFLDKSLSDLAYQAVKYGQRDGWSMADLLRLAHPYPYTVEANYSPLFKYVVDGEESDELPDLIRAAEWLKRHCSDPTVAAFVIRRNRIPREAVPTNLLNEAVVWEALLQDMPLTAMIRNLNKMTAVGLIEAGSDAERVVVEALTDGERLRRARVHPISVLAALKVYEQGHGERGSLTWKPVRRVVNALDGAFYASFRGVKGTGQRIRLALDVSASMDGNKVNGMPFLDARTVSAAMALVTANVEPNAHFVAYSDRMVPVSLRPSMRLDEVIRYLRGIPMGGTVCSLPITAALQDRLGVDAFISYTDSETGEYSWGYRDSMTAKEALTRYREATGIRSKHAVVAATAGDFSVADPSDPFQLDVAGFSPDVPAALYEFLSLV